MEEYRYDMACEILEHANDGDDLEPFELKVLELAANDHLNAAGWEKFEQIYQERVIEGKGQEKGTNNNV